MSVFYLDFFFFFNDTATTEIYTLSLHDALPISDPVDANGEAAVGHFRYRHAGKAVAQELRERAAGRALDLFRRHDGVGNRARWRDPVGPALTRGVFLVGARGGEAHQQPQQPVGVAREHG